MNFFPLGPYSKITRKTESRSLVHELNFVPRAGLCCIASLSDVAIELWYPLCDTIGINEIFVFCRYIVYIYSSISLEIEEYIFCEILVTILEYATRRLNTYLLKVSFPNFLNGLGSKIDYRGYKLLCNIKIIQEIQLIYMV